MPFFRSTAACFHSLWPNVEQALQRQQMNSITSFMDASMVYGHTPGLESSLRDLAGLNGKLVTNSKFKDSKGRPYLPSVAKHSGCQQSPDGDRVECFHAGDARASEWLPLSALQTLFLREHNRIAEVLKHINGHWNPETIYQETRKIIGALIQVGELQLNWQEKTTAPEHHNLYFHLEGFGLMDDYQLIWFLFILMLKETQH